MKLGRCLAVAGFAILLSSGVALAAKCGNTGSGFEAWKSAFAEEAKSNGIKPKALLALESATYATATIKADRNQKSFKLTLPQFLAKRGAPAIVARGKSLKKSNAALFAKIEKTYGVPAGPLIAIWGMESGFGNSTGNQNTLSAVATLAYDCRRSAFFEEQLYAMLELIQSGRVAADAMGAMHGEIGQTQFMPKSVLLYGSGNLNSKEAALISTAQFLVGHGWQSGEGYQPGDTNFGAIEGWNAAGVYQKAIAIMGKQIDGN